MELALFVYLASIVSGLHLLCLFGTMVAIAVSFICALLLSMNPSSSDQSTATVKSLAKRFGIAAACLALLTVVIPNSEKTVYLIGGAWALQTAGEKVATSETSELVVKVIQQKLNAYLEEAATPPPAKR
jgi:hypothetical protein